MKILRNIVLFAGLLLLSAWFPHGYVQSVTVERLKVGDGGWAIGMDLANDGARIMRTDISEAYVWPVGATAWKPCITGASMAGTVFSSVFGNGPWEMVFDPNNSQTIYMLYGQVPAHAAGHLHLFRSTDQCASFQELTNYPANAVADSSGDPNRMSGQRIVVDPNNANVIYVGNAIDGVYRSTNALAAAGSVAFSLISPFVASGNNLSDAGMAIDGNSGTTTLGGLTVSNKVYMPSYNKGIWASTDGGNTFAPISGGQPTKNITFSTSATNTCIMVTVDIFQSTSPSSISGITDTSGLTWARRTQLTGLNTHDIEVWYATSAAIQTNDVMTLTYTDYTVGTDVSTITVIPIEGCDQGTPFDTHAGLPAKNSSSIPVISTTNPNDLIFVYDVATYSSPDSSYTCIATCGANGEYIEYQIVSSAQTSINPGAPTAGSYVQRGWTTDAIQQAGGGTLLVETANVVRDGGVETLSTPYQVLHGRVGCDGIYYVTAGTQSNGHGWKWDGASWTKLLPDLGAPAATATATSSGTTTLNVSAVGYSPYGNGIIIGGTVTGSGVPGGTVIVSGPLSGGAGTYTTNNATTVSGAISVTSPGEELLNIAPDVSPNCSRIFVSTPAFTNHNMSTNDGNSGTWVGYKNDLSGGSGVTVSSAVVPWYVGDGPHTLQAGDGKYSPTTGYLEMSTGFCYYYADMPVSTAGFVQYAMCNGAESTVPGFIVSVPGEHTFFGVLDLAWWADLNPTTYPVHGLPIIDRQGAHCNGTSFDYAGQSPSNMAMICSEQNQTEGSGYSTNGGGTQGDWHLFGGATNPYQGYAAAAAAGYLPPLPASTQVGAIIAMNATDPTNMLWSQVSSSGQIYQTTNGTGSPINWTLIPQSSFTGAPSSAPYGWDTCPFGLNCAASYGRIPVVSDKVDADTFYAYNALTPGLYKSTDKGATWGAPVYSGTLTGETGFLKLFAVPGTAGFLYVISGYDGNSATAGSNMKYSTNYGVAWNNCPNVLNVSSMAFGKAPPASGTGHPTLIINGWVSGVQGIFESEDDCQTWRNLNTNGQPPNDIWNQSVSIVGGDMNTYGVFYTGQQWGSGFTKITLH